MCLLISLPSKCFQPRDYTLPSIKALSSWQYPIGYETNERTLSPSLPKFRGVKTNARTSSPWILPICTPAVSPHTTSVPSCAFWLEGSCSLTGKPLPSLYHSCHGSLLDTSPSIISPNTLKSPLFPMFMYPVYDTRVETYWTTFGDV